MSVLITDIRPTNPSLTDTVPAAARSRRDFFQEKDPVFFRKKILISSGKIPGKTKKENPGYYPEVFPKNHRYETMKNLLVFPVNVYGFYSQGFAQ